MLCGVMGLSGNTLGGMKKNEKYNFSKNLSRFQLAITQLFLTKKGYPRYKIKFISIYFYIFGVIWGNGVNR